jgi:superfamily II DNA or RNA helicase
VKFNNLGLVIIDEEHRFGVRQKERLKALRAEVDVLTLTATPIPRTLSLALEGLREFLGDRHRAAAPAGDQTFRVAHRRRHRA